MPKSTSISTDFKGLAQRNGSWRYRKTIDGKQEYWTLGRVDEISEQEAIQICLNLRDGIPLHVATKKKRKGQNAIRLRDVWEDLKQSPRGVQWKETTKTHYARQIETAKEKKLKNPNAKRYKDGKLAELMAYTLDQKDWPEIIRQWYQQPENAQTPTGTDNAFRVLIRLALLIINGSRDVEFKEIKFLVRF